ncbi:hypothetical protein [Pedobacter sp. Hv1]|uniref:hypothetical protein n=1 Tax=Pedobacter sp. Hv1 TaxID=1740090 RepID=UPI0006D8A90C|nr:hypothetical protein [Pedobacter sp. Hv1]KQB99370.1 hypothetical protein AQF98_17510 [Pedobacter sp. Hv1]
MKSSAIDQQIQQFKQPLLVINAISVIMSIVFIYKHYFNHDGKGVDDMLCAFSIFTLQSFFGLIALTKANSSKPNKIWWFIAIVYTVLATLFIEIELFKGVYFIAVIPIIAYGLQLFPDKEMKMLKFANVAFVLGYITSIVPIFAFIMSIVTLIIGIFNPA